MMAPGDFAKIEAARRSIEGPALRATKAGEILAAIFLYMDELDRKVEEVRGAMAGLNRQVNEIADSISSGPPT